MEKKRYLKPQTDSCPVCMEYRFLASTQDAGVKDWVEDDSWGDIF